MYIKIQEVLKQFSVTQLFINLFQLCIQMVGWMRVAAVAAER